MIPPLHSAPFMVAFSPLPLSQQQLSVRMSLPDTCLISSLSHFGLIQNKKQIDIYSGTLPVGQEQTGLRFPSGVSLPVQKIQTFFYNTCFNDAVSFNEVT